MNVPHGARQQHSTSAPAAGPFSRDFNESFMIIRPLAPRRPAAGGEVLPPLPAPPRRRGRKFRALPRAALFPLPSPVAPAPRFSPCRRPARCRPRCAIPTVVAGRARATLLSKPRPAPVPPAPPRETSWQAHHLSGIMIALSIDGTPGGNGGSISGSTGEPGAGGSGGAGTPAARRAIAPLPHGFRRATAPASAIERIKGGNRHALCRPD